MQSDFITPSDERWTAMLRSAPHDIYHRPEFLRLTAKYEGGDPLAFYGEDHGEKFLIPLLVRQLPPELGAPSVWRDLITPYGYPSPIQSPGSDSSKLDLFIQTFCSACEERNIISAFIRLHPLLPLPLEILEKYGRLVRHGETVAIDLRLSEENMWKQTRENHRRTIKNLHRSGFTVGIDNWDYLEDFIHIYRATMERLGADDFYYFTNEYFYDLKSCLGDLLHLCVVLSPGGEVASGGLFIAGNTGIVEYHLGGTNEMYLKEAPSKLMFDFVRRWAKHAGCDLFHLGGGLGGRSDMLFRFKAGFSKIQRDFYTLRLVFDSTSYSNLNQAWQNRSGEVVDTMSDFFPLYRRSI